MRNLATIRITPDDIRITDWRGVLAEARDRDCSAYSTVFYRRVSDEACGEPAKSVCIVLGALTSLLFKPHDDAEPFGPVMVVADRRSAIVDDFTEDQLQALRDVLEEIDDRELQSRIADVIWLRTRDHRAAAIAVEAYLSVAAAVEDQEEWMACTDRLVRAFRLAATLGRRGESYSHALGAVEDVLARCNGEDTRFLSAKLMELLLDYGEGDPMKYAPLAEKLAAAAYAANDTYRSEEYWNLAARWWFRAKDEPRAHAATKQSAEGFIRAADEAAASESHFRAVLHLQKAIAILRKVAGTRERVDELHKRLVEHQAKSMSEFKPIQVSTDISEVVTVAIKTVEGKPPREALVSFARISSSRPVSALRVEVERSLKEFIAQGLFSTILVSDAGKVTGRKPAAGFGSESPEEDAVMARMFEHARLHQALSAQGLIEPAREVLNREHRLNLSTFMSIARSSHFVPAGRELLFAKGLLAGMVGDYLTAAHILLPQVEHAIRYLLAECGAITSGLDQDGIQDEFDLNRILHNREHQTVLGEAIGEATVFELRGLLVERNGSNLRNVIAHGLLPSGAFFSPPVCYFWWLTFRLCILGTLAVERAAPKGEGDPES